MTDLTAMERETDAIRWACSNHYSREKFYDWLERYTMEIREETRAEAYEDGYDEGYAQGRIHAEDPYDWAWE